MSGEARPPAVLGRGAVVLPGQATPAGLDGASRVVVDQRALASPEQTATRLHRAWVARQPVVVELAVDPAALRQPERSTRPVWQHPADHLFAREWLLHGVWANNADHRGQHDTAPRWWHAHKAAAARLTVAGPADVARTGPSSVGSATRRNGTCVESRTTPWRASWPTTGRATCASSRTPS